MLLLISCCNISRILPVETAFPQVGWQPGSPFDFRCVCVMTEKETVKTSKFLSLILRHEPERFGLKLDSAGWVSVDELLKAVNQHGGPLTLEGLKHVVATNDKKRFAFSEH